MIARQQIRQGIDPSLAKRKERMTREHARANQKFLATRPKVVFDAKLPQSQKKAISSMPYFSECAA